MKRIPLVGYVFHKILSYYPGHSHKIKHSAEMAEVAYSRDQILELEQLITEGIEILLKVALKGDGEKYGTLIVKILIVICLP